MLALTFVSCEDIDFEEGKPQTNPQEPLMSFDGLSVGLGDNLGAALDLSTLSTESLNAVKTVQTPALTAIVGDFEKDMYFVIYAFNIFQRRERNRQVSVKLSDVQGIPEQHRK